MPLKRSMGQPATEKISTYPLGGYKTSTRDPLLRLLYVGVALILRNVWVWLHWEVLAHPRRGGRRLDLAQLTFRAMLLWLQHLAEQILGVCDQVHAQRP